MNLISENQYARVFKTIQIIEKNDILSEFYHDWLNVDTPLGEVLENSIQESIAMVTRYYKSNSKER